MGGRKLRSTFLPPRIALNFLLLTLTLSFHLLCMNAATAGPLVCVWLDWRERRGDPFAGRAGRQLAWWTLGLFFVGMALGGLVAWWEWTPAFWRELLERFYSRIYWGAWELAFSALLLAVYAIWWRFAPGKTAARAGRSLLAVLAATNLMYHFPPLFVVVAKLGSGELAQVGQDDLPFMRLAWQGEALALTVHFWLASLAVAGMMLALIVTRWTVSDDAESAAAARLAVWGGRLALVPTLLQIPVGLWIMMRLPPLRQGQLMGRDLLGSALLAGGVLASLWLMHLLVGLAVGEARRQAVRRSAVLLLIVVLLMTGALRRSRIVGQAAMPAKAPPPMAAQGVNFDTVRAW